MNRSLLILVYCGFISSIFATGNDKYRHQYLKDYSLYPEISPLPPACGLSSFNNYVLSVTYGLSGNPLPIASTLKSSDNFGRKDFIQYKNISKSIVIARKFIYDKYGRQAIVTLPAPIGSANFCYDGNFILNGSQLAYSIGDFDLNLSPNNNNGELYNPSPVSSSSTLGNYYSNSSGNPSIGVTEYPFTRKFYSNNCFDQSIGILGYNQIKATSPNNIQREYQMVSGSELNYVFGPEQSYLTNSVGESLKVRDQRLHKKLIFEPNGGVKVVYENSDGQVVAKCNSEDGGTCIPQEGSIVLEEAARIDVHVPSNHLDDLKIRFPDPQGVYMNGGSYCEDCYEIEIYDVVNQRNLDEGVDFELNHTDPDPRLFDVKFLTLNNTKSHILGITSTLTDHGKNFFEQVLAHVRLTFNPELRFKLDYNNWQLYYYDLLGNNTRVVQPEGVNCMYDAQAYRNDSENTLMNKHGSAVEVYRFAIDPNAANENIVNLNWWPGGIYEWQLSDFSSVGLEGAIPDCGSVETTTEEENYSQVQARDAYFERQDLTYKVNDDGEVSLYGKFLDPTDGDLIGGDISVSPPKDNYLKQTYKIMYRYDLVVYGLTASGGEVELERKPGRYERQITSYRVNMPSTQGNSNPWSYFYSEKYVHFLDNSELHWQDAFKMDDFHFNDLNNLNSYVGIVIKLRNMEKTQNSPMVECVEVSGGVSTNCLSAPDVPIWGDVCYYSIWGGVGHDFLSKPQPIQHKPLQESYTYDEFGNMLSSNTPDNGLASFVYSSRNQLRFSQNAIQDKEGRFTYSNYDKAGRVIEVGVFDNQAAAQTDDDIEYSALPPVGGGQNNIHYYKDLHIVLPSQYISDRIQYFYDLPANGLPAYLTSTFTQNFVRGKLAKSWTDNTTSWYSYTYTGQPEWLITWNSDEGYSTVRYVYDDDQYLVQVSYNELNSDNDFYVKYFYDADKNLVEVKSSEFPDRHFETQSKLVYDDLGNVTRKELGNKFQGVDYTYTLEGNVKSINNAVADLSKDPGQDELSTGSNPATFKDLFAETLSYYDGDYVRNGTYIQTVNQAEDQFSGRIKSSSWYSSTLQGSVYKEDIKNYNFLYDNSGQLLEAIFGTLESGTLNNSTGTGVAPDFIVKGDYATTYGYDLNGNIKNLTRAGYGSSGAFFDDLSYNYSYSGGALLSNKLLSLTDDAGSLAYAEEITSQSEENYIYDRSGRLILDLDRNITIEYDDFSRIRAIYMIEAETPAQLFHYDDRGKLYRTDFLDREGEEIKRNFRSYDASGINYNETDWLYDEEWYAASSKYYIHDHERVATAILGREEDLEYQYELKDHIGNVRVAFRNKAEIMADHPFTSSLHAWSFRSETKSHSIHPQNGLTINTDGRGGIVKIFSINPGQRVTCGVELTALNALGARIALLENGSNINLASQDLIPGYNEISFQNTGVSQLAIHIFIHSSQQAPNSSFTIRDFVLQEEDLEVIKYADYYPFGWEMPGRVYSSSAFANDFAYQGEYARKNDEYNWNEFELRNYDPRIGRFLNPDPARQFYSAYVGMGNDPVNMIDPDGAFSYYNHSCECEWDTRYGSWYPGRVGFAGYQNMIMMNAVADRASVNGHWEKTATLSGMFEVIKDPITGDDVHWNTQTVNITLSWIPHGSAFMARGADGTSILGLSGKDWLEGLQTGLDYAGLAPGLGEIADGLNALIYLARGDYTNAALSGAAMVPFAGWAATGAKLVMASAPLLAKVGSKAAKTSTQTFKSVGAAGRSWKNVKMMSDNLLKKQGLDAHAIKKEFLGGNAKISRHDLYKHTDTGEILIFGKGGKGEPIFTGYFVE